MKPYLGLLAGFCTLLVVPSTGATMVNATGFASTENCGEGLQRVEGFHAAVLNFVSEADKNKSWSLTGKVWKCGGFIPQQMVSPCTVSGNTSTTEYLACPTQNDVLCQKIENGVRSREVAGGAGFFGEHESSCTSPPRCTTPEE